MIPPFHGVLHYNDDSPRHLHPIQPLAAELHLHLYLARVIYRAKAWISHTGIIQPTLRVNRRDLLRECKPKRQIESGRLVACVCLRSVFKNEDIHDNPPMTAHKGWWGRWVWDLRGGGKRRTRRRRWVRGCGCIIKIFVWKKEESGKKILHKYVLCPRNFSPLFFTNRETRATQRRHTLKHTQSLRGGGKKTTTLCVFYSES